MYQHSEGEEGQIYIDPLKSIKCYLDSGLLPFTAWARPSQNLTFLAFAAFGSNDLGACNLAFATIRMAFSQLVDTCAYELYCSCT